MRKTSSKYKSSYSIDLRTLEEEVLSEGREWMQRRLEEKLREKRKSFSPGGGDDAPLSPAPEADGANLVR
jgi:hypothetical protein